jgi:hypothetical protein
MEQRPAPYTPSGKPFPRLSQQEVIIHVLFAVAAAICTTAASNPHSVYVGLRAFVTVYAWVLLSTLIFAHCTRTMCIIFLVAAFVLLNQWLTWSLIAKFGDSTVALAAFIAKLTWGWMAAMVVARVALPVAR